jgi:fluoroacetyl-CoA thioesterase
MKPGLRVGHVEMVEMTVTDDMCPAFMGQVVHRTMSTVTMVYYMEWVARLTILPYLEEGEEGIGGGVSVQHLAPAPVGKTVQFFAEVTEVADRRVVCRVWAEHDKARVGEGEVVQFILPKARIDERIAAMR